MWPGIETGKGQVQQAKVSLRSKRERTVNWFSYQDHCGTAR